MGEQMEPRSADAVFLSAVLYAAVAVLYAQVLQVQRSSLLSVALTPQAPSRSACLPRSRCSPTLRSSCSSHRNTYTVLTLIMLLCIQIRANCPSEPPKTQPRPTYAGARVYRSSGGWGGKEAHEFWLDFDLLGPMCCRVTKGKQWPVES